MAHKKAAASGIRQTKNPTGKRLGIKKYEGEVVVPGNIILKQKGTVIHPGEGTMVARDFSIFAISEGKVSYKVMPKRKGQKIVSVKN